ncbi:MAG: hypothetical protein ACKVVT_19390 [Dehalococcoidia bacterium]
MALNSVLWRLASPYDAYVSHVARLNEAISQIRYLSDRALGYETGLAGSVRIVPGERDASSRAASFRERLGNAAATMSDEQFEDFITMLGGGARAEVESDRAKAATRLSHMTRGLEEYFVIAGHSLATLEKRGYNPVRADVARQLRENGLPQTDLAAYRHTLHDLGVKVGKRQA